MVKDVKVMRIKVEIQISNNDYSIECERSNTMLDCWECKFPTKMPMTAIAEAVLELFHLETVEIKQISFLFQESRVTVLKSLMCVKKEAEFDWVLKRIAEQIMN